MIERESFFPENKRSVSGKNWVFRKIDESQTLMISQNHDLSEIISRVLVSILSSYPHISLRSSFWDI